jgi:hypothetical protein
MKQWVGVSVVAHRVMVPTYIEHHHYHHPRQQQQGADARRQAFSKRKRGLTLKAEQLARITDARVGEQLSCRQAGACVPVVMNALTI